VTVDVKVPALAESIPDATLLEWKKGPGDAVEENEILIELETDKVVLEVPAPASGVLAQILRQTGETVVSEDVLARIEPREQAKEHAKEQASAQAGARPGAQAAATPPPAPAQAAGLSPAVRRLVEEHALDPAAIAGTGKGGRLTKGDVLAYLEQAQQAAPARTPAAAAPARTPAAAAAPTTPAAAAAPSTPAAAAAPSTPAAAATAAPAGRAERRKPMSRLRQRVAERLVEAQQSAAILTTFNEINMGPVMALRKRYRDRFEDTHGVRLGFMSFFVQAAVRALRRFPAVNAYLEGNEIVYHDYCDIGIAVGSPRGLVVPILRNAESMTLAGVESQIAEYGRRAGDGSLAVDDMTGGTFTISNGGVFGSLLSTPILNPPQTAILGMHKTEERAVVENGEIVIRPMMYVALSYDHRVIDGREAVLFLVSIKEAIEDPARLLLDV
jgi:2-oxoglutarate dehydrogenase E2 component (dihydrolipoamide succinyltransferase)